MILDVLSFACVAAVLAAARLAYLFGVALRDDPEIHSDRDAGHRQEKP